MFILQEISGQDPVAATIGATASPEAIAAARERYGLDDPLLVRYVSFLGGLLVGDLGMSFRTRRPVMDDLLAYMPATLELVLFAFVLALILGVAFAVSSMLRWPGASLFRGCSSSARPFPRSWSASSGSSSSIATSGSFPRGARPESGWSQRVLHAGRPAHRPAGTSVSGAPPHGYACGGAGTGPGARRRTGSALLADGDLRSGLHPDR